MTAEKINNDVDTDQDNPDTDTENIEPDEKSDSDKSEISGSDDPVKKLEEELESVRKEAEESYDRFLRVSAEFENFKKRTAREKKELRKFANQAFAEDLLSVVDNLERAIHSSKDEKTSVDCLQNGIDLTLREVQKILEKNNIKMIETVEKTFDPAFHQAVMQEESDDHSENTIISEMQKGYLIHDRLLRPSMVVVAVPVKKDDDPEDNSKNEEK